MHEQLTMLETGENTFSVIEKEKEDAPNDLLKCFRSELASVDYLSVKDLFGGFDTLMAITFSYEIGFINKIMEQFSYAEIVLGADFLTQKDQKTQNLLAEVLTNAYEAGKAVKKYDNLVAMMEQGDIEFRTPSYILDHRKLYLLKSDDGRTRVIKASANMTRQAWSGNQMEHYEYDDTPACYDEYLKEFETAWSESQPVTKEIVSVKKTDDYVNANPILKGVKDTGRTLVVREPEQEIIHENIKYVIDHEKTHKSYAEISKGISSGKKKGLIEINPTVLEKVKHNMRKLQEKTKIKIETRTEQYPGLTIDIDSEEAFLNDEKLNLNPSEAEVKNDIDLLYQIFSNFDIFVSSDNRKLKRTYFKLLNAVFCSPFFAQFRCDAYIEGIATSAIPMFLLIASKTSNGGKTFMIQVALKMMTGKDLDGFKASEFKKNNIRDVQAGVKGIPVFVDEIDNKYLGFIKDIIKNPEICEKEQRKYMPMILFASNDVLKPEAPIRKRMIFFSIDASLPSSIDETGYRTKGIKLRKGLGTGLYHEYLRRMAKRVKEELEYLIDDRNKPEEYYPDLLAISSETIISILEDFGYTIPEYISRLSWRDDYSPESNADDVAAEIEDFIRKNKKECKITRNEIIIELGSDNNSRKKIESWVNILPAEMKATSINGKDFTRITIDRKELEARLGHRLTWFRLLS